MRNIYTQIIRKETWKRKPENLKQVMGMVKTALFFELADIIAAIKDNDLIQLYTLPVNCGITRDILNLIYR